VTDPAGSLIDYLGFVCREFNRGGAAFESPAVRASVEDSIIGMMKALQAGHVSVCATPSPVIPGLVLRAERFMDQHLTDDIAIDDIAIAAGVPARTLYHAFTQFRGLSPMRSLRARRLDQARRDLITGAQGSVNILEIANRYGMQHGGRFAAHYQQQFHETPSETVRAARLALPSLLANFLDPER
jgi:transcriptional regulator GlxA family with amidase domain